jgi:hypothetical protein
VLDVCARGLVAAVDSPDEEALRAVVDRGSLTRGQTAPGTGRGPRTSARGQTRADLRDVSARGASASIQTGSDHSLAKTRDRANAPPSATTSDGPWLRTQPHAAPECRQDHEHERQHSITMTEGVVDDGSRIPSAIRPRRPSPRYSYELLLTSAWLRLKRLSPTIEARPAIPPPDGGPQRARGADSSSVWPKAANVSYQLAAVG